MVLIGDQNGNHGFSGDLISHPAAAVTVFAGKERANLSFLPLPPKIPPENVFFLLRHSPVCRLLLPFHKKRLGDVKHGPFSPLFHTSNP